MPLRSQSCVASHVPHSAMMLRHGLARQEMWHLPDAVGTGWGWETSTAPARLHRACACLGGWSRSQPSPRSLSPSWPSAVSASSCSRRALRAEPVDAQPTASSRSPAAAAHRRRHRPARQGLCQPPAHHGRQRAHHPRRDRPPQSGRRRLFECCVDLDYRARNTIGNAIETRRWVTRRTASTR